MLANNSSDKTRNQLHYLICTTRYN